MKINSTHLDDVLLITPEIHKDERGYFYESYNKKKFEELTNRLFDSLQDNESSSVKGALRGIHFQSEPHAQAKLVRVLDGEIYDVAIDLRKKSKTYCKWVGVYLSSENSNQLFIPEGFGHAFLVTSDHAKVAYKVNNYYSPEHERCIKYDDPSINVIWPDCKIILSEKDAKGEIITDESKFF